MKKVSILFTQKQDWFSIFLRTFLNHEYTHVSLGLTDDQSEFFSFNKRGFTRETYEKFRQHNTSNGLLYQAYIDDDAYHFIRNCLDNFQEKRENMKYSSLGVFLNLLHIPLHMENQYFCSEFVAEMLRESNAIKLKKTPQRYLPDQLRCELDNYSKTIKWANVF